MSKVMVPPEHTSRIAWRREPGPLSAFVVTTTLGLQAASLSLGRVAALKLSGTRAAAAIVAPPPRHSALAATTTINAARWRKISMGIKRGFGGESLRVRLASESCRRRRRIAFEMSDDAIFKPG